MAVHVCTARCSTTGVVGSERYRAVHAWLLRAAHAHDMHDLIVHIMLCHRWLMCSW